MKTSSTTDGQPTVTWVLEAKFKKLTDEEIIDCVEMDFVKEALHNKTPEYMWIIDFARAILRKASE